MTSNSASEFLRSSQAMLLMGAKSRAATQTVKSTKNGMMANMQ